MIAEVEGLREAEKAVEKYLRNMTSSERKDEISYYRSTLSRAAYQKCSDCRESANSSRYYADPEWSDSRLLAWHSARITSNFFESASSSSSDSFSMSIISLRAGWIDRMISSSLR
jgi:hypothetical protein